MLFILLYNKDMEKIKKSISLMFLLNISISMFADQTPVKIVTEEWAPYNYVQDGEIVGYSVEVIQHILAILGQEYYIEMLPGVRSKHVLLETKNTFMATIYRTEERENQFKWIGPIAHGTIHFYKKSDNPVEIHTLEDAKKVSTISCRYVGIIPDLLHSYGFTNLDSLATTSEQIYNKLLHDRCDLAISDTDIGVRLIVTKMGFSPFAVTKIMVPVFEGDLYIACNKNTPDEVVQQWQDAFDSLKEDKTLELIYKKYF